DLIIQNGSVVSGLGGPTLSFSASRDIQILASSISSTNGSATFVAGRDFHMSASGLTGIGTCSLSFNASRDLNILAAPSVPAFNTPQNGAATLTIERDLNSPGGTGASCEAQIGNHTGAASAGAITFTSIGRNINMSGGSFGGYALIGHGRPG